MNDDQFTKLFAYIEDFRNEVNAQFGETAKKSSLDKLTNTIDGFVKRLDINESEQQAKEAQFERLLEWAREVSKKTGVPLNNL